jgi:VPDSG-CTERM motif
MQKEETNQ